MEGFNKSNFRTSRNLNYTFYHFQGDASKPTIVMCHGWPDEALLWKDVVPHLTPLGFSILVPDLLGFGETDKPLDTTLYGPKSLAQDITELADHVNAGSLISLGHDWGAWMAQRLYFFNQQRVKALFNLSVSIMLPSPAPFNLKQMNDELEKTTGFPRMAYWELLTSDDAEELILNHLESFWCGLYQNGPSQAMIDLFSKRGAFREFLEQDKRLPLREFAKDSTRKADFFAKAKERGLKAGFNWYKSKGAQFAFEEEKDLKIEKIEVPYYFIGCDQDGVCLTAYNEANIQKGVIPNCTKTEISASHWGMLEKPDEVGMILSDWLKPLTSMSSEWKA